MTITEFFDMLHARRRYHLRRLMEDGEEQRELAEKLNLHPTYLCALLAGRVPFSEKRARAVEHCFGLKFGALDTEV